MTANTLTDATLRNSPVGMEMIQIAEMTSKLKAADPTMVPGPSSPATKFFPTISMTDSRISGADVPKASRDRLATVSFHTCQMEKQLFGLFQLNYKRTQNKS